MKVVLGVTGSIAAYKACEIVRLLVKRGDDVRVVMTAHAREFVTPLTFQTLSRNPVECDIAGCTSDGEHPREDGARNSGRSPFRNASGDEGADRCCARDEFRYVGKPGHAGERGVSGVTRRPVPRAGRGRACLRHVRARTHG